MCKHYYIIREFGGPTFAGRYWVKRRPYNASHVHCSSLPRPDLQKQARVSGGYTQLPLLPGKKKNG